MIRYWALSWRYSAIYYIKSFRSRFILIFVSPWSMWLPNCPIFFKFYDSSFVLTDLLLAAFCSVTFYDVTVNFTMPQFVLNAISRGYFSRPNLHWTRPNKLRRTSIKIMFSAEWFRVVPPLSPHIISDSLPLNFTFSYTCNSLKITCLRLFFSRLLNLIVPYHMLA